MVDVSGIPNMGFGGGGYFGGSAALGYPAMSAAQINASMGFNPNAAQFNPFANTPGGFGAQTAAYQQAAANSYGNINAATLYGSDPWNPYATQLSQQGGGDIWSQGAAPFNPYGGGANPGGFSPSPNYPGGNAAPDYSAWYSGLPGGGQAYNSWNMGLPPQGGFGVPGSGGSVPIMGFGGGVYADQAAADAAAGFRPNPYAGMILGPQANPTYYNPGTYAGDQSNYGLPYYGRSLPGDIGFSQQPSYPNLGYSPTSTFDWSRFGVMQSPGGGSGGIGSDANYGGQGGIYSSQAQADAAAGMLRAGQGWTIAQQPPAASQGYLANRINQSIYDVGNAGDYYSRMIGGGFGMGMPNQGQGLTPQDLAIPHAYPPEVRAGFRWDQQ